MKKLLCLVLGVILLVTPLVSCGVEPHTHTYDNSKWVADASGHWHAATCSCKGEEADFAAHTDANDDGICDICAFEGDHEHIYADNWTADASGHWHNALCHTVTDTKAAHTFNVAGFCSTCNYDAGNVVIDTFAKALEIGAFQDSLVKSGTINGGNMYYAEVATYEFGDGVTIVTVLEGSSKNVTIYTKVGEDSVFAVRESYYDGALSSADAVEAVVENLNGYMFFDDNFGGDWETTRYYGVVDLLGKLYEASQGEGVDAVEQVEGNVYYLTFTHPTSQNSISIAVELDAKYHYIKQVDITTGSMDSPYYYSITQSIGDDVVSPYDPEEVLISDFTMKDADGVVITDSITISQGTDGYIYLDDIAPDSAVVALNAFTCDADEGLIAEHQTYDWVLWQETNRIYLYSDVVDNYTLTISTAKVTKVVHVTVEAASVTYIESSVGDEVNVYAGNAQSFYAYVNNFCDASYTAAIISDNASDATLTPGATALDESVFVSSVLGDYTIELTSVVNPDVKSTFVIHVLEAPTMSVISGKYVDANLEYILEFIPAETGATYGIIDITYATYDWEMMDTVYHYGTMSYSYSGLTMTIEYVSGDAFDILSVVMSENLEDPSVIDLAIEVPDYGDATYENMLSPYTLAGELFGNNTYNSADNAYSMTFSVIDGYVSVSNNESFFSACFNFDVEDNGDGTYSIINFVKLEDMGWMSDSVGLEIASAVYNYYTDIITVTTVDGGVVEFSIPSYM